MVLLLSHLLYPVCSSLLLCCLFTPWLWEGAVVACNGDSHELGASYPVCLLSTEPLRADSAVCSIGVCPALRELFRKISWLMERWSCSVGHGCSVFTACWKQQPALRESIEKRLHWMPLTVALLLAYAFGGRSMWGIRYSFVIIPCAYWSAAETKLYLGQTGDSHMRGSTPKVEQRL